MVYQVDTIHKQSGIKWLHKVNRLVEEINKNENENKQHQNKKQKIK